MKIRSITLALILMLTVSVSYAQPTFPGGGDDIEDEAPISALVVLGLAVGAAVGVKKLK